MNVLKLKESFSALASETRLRLLEVLKDKELACEDPENCSVEDPSCDVSEIVEELGITAPSVSQHLKELRRAGLIECDKNGRHVYCRLNREALEDLAEELSSL